jgi:hypothetical protein
MVQIGNVPEIVAVENRLEEMKREKLIETWELPYRNLLTRLDAAIFFLTPVSAETFSEVSERLAAVAGFSFESNVDMKLSRMQYKIRFNNGAAQQQTAKQ